MDRVYKSGAVGAPPAAAENASGPYPTAGNPGVTAPTKPGPFWFHMITESLAQCILGAGLALDKNVLTRLKEAIVILGSQGSWSTGDVKQTYKAVADAGWVMMNDGTIGSAASGATTRANADTVTLYTLLWGNVTNTWAPVSGGRGANAAADFAANKTITLPKNLGRVIAAAGAGSGLTSRALGESLGVETVALIGAELPPHQHTMASHTHAYESSNGTAAGAGGSGGSFLVSGGWAGGKPTGGPNNNTTDSTGSGTAHQNMPPAAFRNFMIKL